MSSYFYTTTLLEAVERLSVDFDMIKVELNKSNYDRAFLFITKAMRDMLSAYSTWDRAREECKKYRFAIKNEDEIEKRIAILRGRRPFLLDILDARLDALASGNVDEYDSGFMDSKYKKLLDISISDVGSLEEFGELFKCDPFENYRKGIVSSACE